MASVKDRLAYAVIKDARDSGALKPGQTVIEATSGNTGIALAMVCAVMGHPFVATMVETFSIERRKVMRALGAKVILTPAAERGSGMVARAEALAAYDSPRAARAMRAILAIAPAATRPIVSRAEERPPPSWLRMPNLLW